MRTSRPGQSALLLLDAVEILQRENIRYAVIGAFALSVHGIIRASINVDALLFTTPDRLPTLRTIFERAGFRAELRSGDEQDNIRSMLILSDGHNNRVDLLAGLRGMDPHICDRTVEVPFMNVKLCIVGREDLIAMKCFAGGPQDMLDARSAYHSSQGPVNLDLLRILTRRFGRDAADRLEHIVAE